MASSAPAEAETGLAKANIEPVEAGMDPAAAVEEMVLVMGTDSAVGMVLEMLHRKATENRRNRSGSA